MGSSQQNNLLANVAAGQMSSLNIHRGDAGNWIMRLEYWKKNRGCYRSGVQGLVNIVISSLQHSRTSKEKHGHCPSSRENQKLTAGIAPIAVELGQAFIFLLDRNHLVEQCK